MNDEAYLDYEGLTELIKKTKNTILNNSSNILSHIILQKSITLEANNWANKIQTVNCSDISENEDSNLIIPIPNENSKDLYSSSRIECISQGENTLTFKAGITPLSKILVWILIIKIEDTIDMRGEKLNE